MNSLNWEHLQTFSCVVQAGSLSAAAHQLGCSQPTLSRHIQALEQHLRIQLFQRTSKGLQLTPEGQVLVDAAIQMEKGSVLFQRQASGLFNKIEGTLRISVDEIVGVYLLPPALVAFRKSYPQVQIEIVISNEASSLSHREADVALRMFQPKQLDLVVRRLPDLLTGFYAHPAYVESIGEPMKAENYREYSFIGFDESERWIHRAAALGFPFQRKDFFYRTDNMISQLALARAGGGIVLTHVGLAEQWPDLVRVLPSLSLPSLPLYTVCHQDTRYNYLIRAFTTFLAEWFQQPYAKAVL